MKTSYGEKKDEKRKIKAEARRLEKREDKSFIFLNKWVLVSRRISNHGYLEETTKGELEDPFST